MTSGRTGRKFGSWVSKREGNRGRKGERDVAKLKARWIETEREERTSNELIVTDSNLSRTRRDTSQLLEFEREHTA